jgi:hypothetical protein
VTVNHKVVFAFECENYWILPLVSQVGQQLSASLLMIAPAVRTLGQEQRPLLAQGQRLEPDPLLIVLNKTPDLIRYILKHSKGPYETKFLKACLISLLLIDSFINEEKLINQEERNLFIETAADFLNYHIEPERPETLLRDIAWNIRFSPWRAFKLNGDQDFPLIVVFSHPIKLKVYANKGDLYSWITIEHPTVYNILRGI